MCFLAHWRPYSFIMFYPVWVYSKMMRQTLATQQHGVLFGFFRYTSLKSAQPHDTCWYMLYHFVIEWIWTNHVTSWVDLHTMCTLHPLIATTIEGLSILWFGNWILHHRGWLCNQPLGWRKMDKNRSYQELPKLYPRAPASISYFFWISQQFSRIFSETISWLQHPPRQHLGRCLKSSAWTLLSHGWWRLWQCSRDSDD